MRYTLTQSLIVSFALFLTPLAHAATVNIGELIDNGEFGTDGSPTLTDWSTTGTVNARASTDTINTSTGNAGFNSFFTDSLAVLGDTSGTIAGAPDSGDSTLSQTFTLPALQSGDNVSSYDLTISFLTAFDGVGGAGGDDFFATLDIISL